MSDLGSGLDPFNNAVGFNIKPQEFEWLHDFMSRMKNQDNRCTAWPYYIVAQSKKYHISDADHCDEYRYYYCDDAYVTEESEIPDEYKDKDTEPVYIKYHWEDVNIHFTMESYNEFVRRDRHNHLELRSYIKYANRNSEYEELFRILGQMTGVGTPKR